MTADDTALRIGKVMARTGLTRSTIYRMMAAGEFPRQRRLAHRVAVWSEREVAQWLRKTLERAA